MRSIASRRRHIASRLAVLVFLAGLALWAPPSIAGPAAFQPVRGMMLLGGRLAYAMAALPSGNVLIAGGLTGIQGTTVSDSAEIYNPRTGLFTLSRGHMTARRSKASVTVLPNGNVLIAGGQDARGILQTADLYDPETDSFAQTGAPMSIARIAHTATLLKDGTVLIAGGTGVDAHPQDTAEIYDPVADRFTPLANHMTTPRSDGVAALLDDGEVLIAGGTFKRTNIASTDIYDPETRKFLPGP